MNKLLNQSNRIKTLTILTLALFLLFIFSPTKSFASLPLTASISSISGQVGETVTVDLNLTNVAGNAELGIVASSLTINYDPSVLELVSTSMGPGVPPGAVLSVNPTNPEIAAGVNRGQIVFLESDETQGANLITRDGTFARIAFKIKDTAASGEYPVSFSPIESDNSFTKWVGDYPDDILGFILTSGRITVTLPAPAAPTTPIQNDVNNTYGWTNVAGYTQASDYEYSVNGGTNWATCTANPQSLPDAAYAIGAVKVRVKADSTIGRPAGATLSSTAAYTVNPTAPVAPTAPVQNDVNNTFGWTNVPGFTQAAKYEYSVDGGTNWATCTANPQSLTDAAYAIGAVQVRVKADSTIGRPAGATLSSTAVYTVNPTAPAAPTAPVQNDANNTFGWTNVAGFTQASDYEYSVNGGTNWAPCTANPQSLPNAAYAIGAVKVRVKADSTIGRPTGATLNSTAAYTVNPTAPAAPRTPVQNDVNNTFGWTNVAGFTQAMDYEYSVDRGANWATCTANPQTLPDGAYAIGAVQVRVKADGTIGRPAGATLSSTAAYTVNPTAPVAPTAPVQNDVDNTFGWTNVAGFTQATNYEYSVDGGTNWATCTANPQSLPDADYAIGAVKVRVKADGTIGRPAGATLSSTAAYTVNPILPITYQSASVDTTNKIVTLVFSGNIFNNTQSANELKNAIAFAADGNTFSALSESDTVSIDAESLVINFRTAIKGDENIIKIAANTLKGSKNQLVEAVTTEPIIAFDECFIATAAFGSKNQTDVVLLRQFRDQFLLTNPIGKAFVETYYTYSPPIAQTIAGNVLLKFMTRIMLLPLVVIVYMLFHPVLLVGILSAVTLMLVQRRKRNALFNSK